MVKILRIGTKVVDNMEEWTAKYRDVPHELEKMDKITIEIYKV